MSSCVVHLPVIRQMSFVLEAAMVDLTFRIISPAAYYFN